MGTKQGLSSLTASVQHCTGGYSQFIEARKRKKWYPYWKDRCITIFIHRQHDPVCLYIQNSKESTKLLELIRVWQGCKIQDQYIYTKGSYSSKYWAMNNPKLK